MPEEPLPSSAPACLVVGVAARESALAVVEAASGLAKALGLPWVAAYVSQAQELSAADAAALRAALALAERLGAELCTLQDAEIGPALLRLVEERQAKHVVLGAPQGRWDRWRDASGLRELARIAGLQVHLVGGEGRQSRRPLQLQAGFIQYWYTLWISGAVLLLNLALVPLFGYRGVGFVFLCALLLQSLFHSSGPLFFAALLSALAWDYFFIPPHFQLAVSNPDDAFMIAAFFVTALITGLLTLRVRRHQTVLEARQRRSELLYRLVHAMALGKGRQPLREVAEMLQRALRREFMVFVTGPDGSLARGWEAGQAFPLWLRDEKAAAWAVAQGRPCGWSTDTFPQADGLYIPLWGKQGVVGLLLCRPQGRPAFSFEEQELLDGAATQLGLLLEREKLEAGAQEASRLQHSEHLHQTLLNSLSHELRTPLTALLGSANALQDAAALQDPPRRQGLLDDLAQAGDRLNRVVENLLDMARLSSGVLALKEEWQDPAELLHLTLQGLKGPLARHRLQVLVPDELPLVRMDYRLMEHALANLLLNAAAYSPEGSLISVQAVLRGQRVEWVVADHGSGIPEEALGRIFDKFYRSPGSPAGGLGLGLHIVQSLLQAHGGEVRVRNQPGAGAEFTLSLPWDPAPAPPLELAS